MYDRAVVSEVLRMNWITLIALGIGFVVGIILIPVFIPILKKLKFGQQVREDGPQAHLKKSGIPTMGGICIRHLYCRLPSQPFFTH